VCVCVCVWKWNTVKDILPPLSNPKQVPVELQAKDNWQFAA